MLNDLERALRLSRSIAARKDRINNWCSLYIVVLVTASICSFIFHTAAIVLLVIFCLSMPFAWFFLMRPYEKDRREYWDLLYSMEARLTEIRRRRVLKVYEYYPDSVLSEYECQEAHIPGDCPLCGAE